MRTVLKYHTVGTVLKYHTVRTVLKYHTVGTVLKYHTVRTVLKYHTVGTVLKFQLQNHRNRDEIYTTNTYILYHSLSWLGFVWFCFIMFNATFNNISAISWRPVLLVEETRVPGENHWLVASHWQTLSHNVVSSTPQYERGSNSQL